MEDSQGTNISMLLIRFQIKLAVVHRVSSRQRGQRLNSGSGPCCIVHFVFPCVYILIAHGNSASGNSASVGVCESPCGWSFVSLCSPEWNFPSTRISGAFCCCRCSSHLCLCSGSAVVPCAGWAWSTTARATAAGTRPPWAASWLLWCRRPSTATTGPCAAARSWRDTSSEFLPHLMLLCWTKCHNIIITI